MILKKFTGQVKIFDGTRQEFTRYDVKISMTKALFKEMVSTATPRELETMAQVMGEKPRTKDYEVTAKSLLDHLNGSTSRKYRAFDANKRPTENLKLIISLLRDDRTYWDIQGVINHKVTQWLHDKKMSKYLRPITLFRKSNFDCYLNEVGT